MRRRVAALVAVTVLLLVVALPVLATKPEGAGKDTSPITLNGTVELTTDADGREIYTLLDGGKTYTLEAGPAWFFGDHYPLKPYVGKQVTIEGEAAAGSTDVEVVSVDGTRLREAGKPPWAGGWRAVGAAHPGWSQAKADRMQAKFGDCFPPGQCKDKPAKDHPGEPDESEAPD